MAILYNCRIDGDQYRISKFDEDMNVESSYLLTERECSCPAGSRPTCRHRQMLGKFITREAIGTTWFYDFDRGGWVNMEPIVSQPAPDDTDNIDWDKIAEERLGQRPLAEPAPERTFDQAADFRDDYGPDPLGEPPPEITVLDLSTTSPADLYDTIAEAVGEPKLRRRI